LMLQALRDSGGTAVAVSDNRIIQVQRQLASQEGMFVSLEAAATVAALEELVAQNWIAPHERVLIFNTGNGLKHRILLT